MRIGVAGQCLESYQGETPTTFGHAAKGAFTLLIPQRSMPLDSKEEDMSIVDLVVALQASEGRSEELRDTLKALREATLQEPGCLDYRIAQGSLSANRFFLLERWVDAEALFRHEDTPHFLDSVARVRACCEYVDLQPIGWLLE